MPPENNFAFIDSNNLYQAISGLGWKLDFAKFRKFLSDKYNVRQAYLFLGFMPANQAMYTTLQQKGYILVFKPTLTYGNGKTKGNCDADLVLKAMIEYGNYDKAVVVSGDGDFYSLIDYLKTQNKLKQVLVPDQNIYSALLKNINTASIKYLSFISPLRGKLEYFSRPKTP